MSERLCLIGLDEPEYQQIQSQSSVPLLAWEMLPRIRVRGNQLWVESEIGSRFVPVSKVVFHGIFEDDLDFLAALALWGGPCFPNPHAMMDCRLRLPSLVRALRFTRFPMPNRGFVSPGVEYPSDTPCVAKWGNWHCGENKERFTDAWQSREPCLIEPFLIGESVRVVMIGDRLWQIRLTGDGWKRSVHGAGAGFMPIDPELAQDTRAVRDGFRLDLIANDYLVTEEGSKHLLEVNHIPSVTCFPELWEAYRDRVVNWLSG